MSLLPELWSGDGGSSRELMRAGRAQRRAELLVFGHGLGAQVKAQCDQIDSEALGDALKTALDEEIGLLTYGRGLAADDRAALELVAKKLEMQAAIDNRRISRRFGG